MDLHFRFGIAGAALGMFIGIIGSIIAAPPFGYVIFRIILATLLGSGLGFGIFFVIRSFLPELLSNYSISGESSIADDGIDSSGRVNITMPEEGYIASTEYLDDEAQSSQRRYRADDENSDETDSDSSLIAEVSEGRHSGMSSVGDPSFNEDAFYQGVDRLPDIGGFSEQFQDQDTDGTVVGDEDTPLVSSTSSTSSRKSSSNGKGNMDPELIAKAIRTALKKDDH